LVEASDTVFEGLLRALVALSKIDCSKLKRSVFKELAENPSLERLEEVLAFTKLIEV